MKKISGTKPLSEQADTLGFDPREDGALPSGAAKYAALLNDGKEDSLLNC